MANSEFDPNSQQKPECFGWQEVGDGWYVLANWMVRDARLHKK